MSYTADEIANAIRVSKAQGFSDADIATGLRLRGVTQEQVAAALAPATTTVAPAATTTTAATTTSAPATTTASTTTAAPAATTTAPAAASTASTATAAAPQSVQAQIAASLGVPVGSVAIRYGTTLGGREGNTELQDTSKVIGYAVKNND